MIKAISLIVVINTLKSLFSKKYASENEDEIGLKTRSVRAQSVHSLQGENWLMCKTCDK